MSWSERDEFLLYLDGAKNLEAYDAIRSRTFEPTREQIDNWVGSAYRHTLTAKQTVQNAEISPSRKWSYLGALIGGIDPYEINGRYYDGIGARIPYRFGFMDARGALHEFSAPKEYRDDPLYPLAWTPSDQLIFAIGDQTNKVLLVDPPSGKCSISQRTPPEPDAFLIAMK